MNLSLRRFLLAALGVASLTMLQACVIGGAGVEGGGAELSYGADFYEPYGYDYGGWGPGYRVGPPRGGDHRPEHPAGRPPPAYRPAPPSRPMPSIPTRPRPR